MMVPPSVPALMLGEPQPKSHCGSNDTSSGTRQLEAGRCDGKVTRRACRRDSVASVGRASTPPLAERQLSHKSLVPNKEADTSPSLPTPPSYFKVDA